MWPQNHLPTSGSRGYGWTPSGWSVALTSHGLCRGSSPQKPAALPAPLMSTHLSCVQAKGWGWGWSLFSRVG